MVHEYVRSLGAETREWLLALFVDGEFNLLAVETIGRGDISSVPVDFAKILGRANLLAAKAFVLVHNHPSGDPRASEADIRVTNRLRHVSAEVDIPLLDHCIVAGNEIVAIGGL